MYATTRQFLDYFNLKNLDQLPALAEIRDFDTLTAELGFTDLKEDVEQEADPATPESPENDEDEPVIPAIAAPANEDLDPDADPDPQQETVLAEPPDTADGDDGEPPLAAPA